MADYKTQAETIESILKSLAIIIGAIWVYIKFIRTRESHPRIQFDLSLRIIGRQKGKILIEVIGILENKGQVRHVVNNFAFDILILSKDKEIIRGDKRINYQVLFEKYHGSGNGISNNRIVWIPEEWYGSFVDPGVKQEYTYLSEVPDNTTFISIYSQFYFVETSKLMKWIFRLLRMNIAEDFQTCQKTFSVEKLEKQNSI